MKVDLKVLRWILLGLYIAVVIGLFGLGYSGRFPEWLFLPLNQLAGKLFWTIFVLVVTVFSQALFIFGAGTVNLCRPIRRGRVILPILIGSLMMAILVGALLVSLTELADVDVGDWFEYTLWTIMGLSWLAWSIIFFLKYRDTERYRTMKGLISRMITGSLLELLAAIPSHLIVSRRPGCFVGMMTAAGIAGGIMVILWAFGPGVILLFLHQKRKAELAQPEK